MLSKSFNKQIESKVCYIGYTKPNKESDINSVLDIIGNITNHKISKMYFNRDESDVIENSDGISEDILKIKNSFFDYIIISSKSLLKLFCPSLLKLNNFNNLSNKPQYSDEFGDTKIIVLNDLCMLYTKSPEDQEDIINLVSDSLSSKTVFYDIEVKKLNGVKELKRALDEISEYENEYIGYDIETNAGEAFTESSFCTILSISTSTPNSDKIVSYYYETSNNQLTDEEKFLFSEFFKKKYKKVWTYNASMEIKWSKFLFNEFYKFQDARILVNMHGIRGTLKNVAKNNLNIQSWELSVSDFINDISGIFTAISNLEKKGKDNDLVTYIKSGEYKDISNNCSSLAISDKLKNMIDNMIFKWGEGDVQFALTQYPYSWAAVPRDILGVYCAYDSAYTVLLAKKFDTKDVKLSYNIYIRHPWLASKFEINGVPWDDEQADRVLKESYDKIFNLLYELIEFSSATQEEKLNAKTIFYSELPYDVVTYTEKKNIERRKPVTTRLEQLLHLKTILNLSSNTKESRKKFWDAYLTEDIKLSGILLLFIENMELNQKYNPIFRDTIGKNYNLLSPNIEETLSKIIDIQENSLDKGLSNAISNSISFAFEKIEDYLYRYEQSVIKFHYKIQVTFFGVDIEDENTWNDKLKMLFNLFYIKKLEKMIGFINKKIGRDSVWYSKLINDIPLRLSNYNDTKPNNYDLMIMNTDFNVLGADTTRWTAGWHTWPPESPGRRCFITRKPDEIWIHADYSQAELVVLSVMSKDEKMVEAFRNGLDLHQFTASEVFKVPYDEVTSAKRKAAKGVNFGIVYGKSLESLAVDITHGNIEEAQALLDMFFSTFPRIKEYILSKNRQVDEFGYVTTLFGNRIYIDTTTKGNEKYRQSVNYPIQASSNAVAGTAMFSFIDECEKQGYYNVPIGFTHDALDSLFKVDDLFEITDLMVYKLQTEIREKTNIPMTIDYEMSVDSFNLCHVEIDNDEDTITVIGSEEGSSKLIERFKNAKKFKITSENEISRKTKKASWEEMFTNGKALNDSWGKEVTEVTTKLRFER